MMWRQMKEGGSVNDSRNNCELYHVIFTNILLFTFCDKNAYHVGNFLRSVLSDY